MTTSPTPTKPGLQRGLRAVVRVLFTAKHSELAQPAIAFRHQWLGLLGLVFYVLLLITFVLYDIGRISQALSGHEPMDWPARWLTLTLIVLHVGPALLALGRPLAAWRMAVVGALVTIGFALVISSISGHPFPAWTTGTLGYLPVVALAVARSHQLDAGAIGGTSAVIAVVGSLVNPRFEVPQWPLLLAALAAVALGAQATRSRQYVERGLVYSRPPRVALGTRLRQACAVAVRVLFTAKHGELTPPPRMLRNPRIVAPALVGYLGLLWVVARDEFPTLSHYVTGESVTESQPEGLGLWIAALLVVLHIAPALVALFRPLAAWRMAVVGALTSIVFAVLVSPVKIVNSPGRHVERLVNGQLVEVTTVPSFSYHDVSPWTQATLAYVLVLGLVVARAPRRDATAIIVVSSVIAVLGTFTDWRSALPLPAVTICAVVVLVQLWRSQRAAAELEGKLERVSRTAHDEHDKRTVLEERARIARELHDVVAHHLSLIAVRTESAGARLGDLRNDVRGELTEIGAAAREALAETRQLLGVLRRDGDGPEVHPQPKLDDVPRLVQEANASGVPTRLTVVGQPAEVPANVGLAVYRVVQEALTNARQHAPGAQVEVRLEYTDEGIAVEVDNEPPSEPTPAEQREGDGIGHGLTGMRERVHFAGGAFAAAPRLDGGFRVTATIPSAQPQKAV